MGAEVYDFPDASLAERAVGDMALVYGYKFESKAQIEAYMRAISDLRPDVVVRACEAAVKHERYFPRPASLRQYLTIGAEQAPGRFTLPQMWHNPETGREELMFRCRDCQDSGWVQAGPPKRDGIDAATLALYSSVRRCQCKRRSA